VINYKIRIDGLKKKFKLLVRHEHKMRYFYIIINTIIMINTKARNQSDNSK